MKADFSGWATKSGIECADGRTIMANAFKHMDGMQVPLVWSHGHASAENVLGHAILEARPEGVYAYGFFNDSAAGQHAKTLVVHKDISALSIFANKLVERSKQVFHGMIREVSLVLAGANPKALIDNISIAHGDGEFTTLEDEAIIFTGLELEHADMAAGSDSGKTGQDVYDSMDPDQKDLLYYMINSALESQDDGDGADAEPDPNDPNEPADGAKHSDDSAEGDLTHQEGNTEVTRNVFDKTDDKNPAGDQHVLSHGDVRGIVQDAIRLGSMKAAVEGYAIKHGIDNIDVLFPNAKAISNTPEFISRRMEWVASVLAGPRHSPFARIKNYLADITQDDARAKGYIKGNMKKEEFFGLTKRTTAPTTVYKKQKLDRDDIIDITDLDIISFLKEEMRLMLDEEVARAIMIGDGRAVDDVDKIKDPAGAVDGIGIRSILNDHEIYVTTLNVNISDASSSYTEVIEEIMRGMRFYRGSGSPVFYTTLAIKNEMLLLKDTLGRRLYQTVGDLAAAMGVSGIVPMEVMESVSGLIGIVVNLSDYMVGTDKGGEINMFDFFDIDYNQNKYLMETRLSGALVKYRSAIVVKSTASANVLVSPITDPSFVIATGVVTIPTQTGVVYKNSDTLATLSAGAQAALAAGATLNVIATPATNYYFESNAEDEWSFTRPAV
jgi:hypothetical protein